MNTFESQIAFNELVLNYSSVYLALGYQNNLPPKYIIELIQKMLNEVEEILQIKGGFQIHQNDFSVIDKTKIVVDNIEFYTQRIITTQLKKAEGAVIFACTLGKGFDDWRKKFTDDDDMLKVYIADILGSELVEAATDVLESKIADELSTKNFKITNRYSPGYCDWNVYEQHKLFSLLPEKFCGIKLTESALMLPIKSVSGIIGFGSNVKKKEYNCKICSMENCYLRVREVKEEGENRSLEV
ncbi:MAG: methionine synthase [Ignavibacteriae bacterium]|nr:methionine synthase [Ignavibacteriota bacterium]NOG96785.1 methionine synthase [Ignavibacteriota bacterium]